MTRRFFTSIVAAVAWLASAGSAAQGAKLVQYAHADRVQDEVALAQGFWSDRHASACSVVSVHYESGMRVMIPGQGEAQSWGWGEDCAVALNPDLFGLVSHSLVDRRRELQGECTDVFQQVGAANGVPYSAYGLMGAWSPIVPWTCRSWARRLLEASVA